jgi:hypothetical protein
MLSLIAAAGIALGPVRMDETFYDVVASVGQGTVTRRCYGRDDMPASTCSRALEYASGHCLITVSFDLVDGVERTIDILIDSHADTKGRRFQAARKVKSSFSWTWEGHDVISEPVPIFVKGWRRKGQGVFIRSDGSGVAAVFERGGRLWRFRLSRG